jgi:hypothetical protein
LIQNRGLELPTLCRGQFATPVAVNASKSAQLILDAVRAGYVQQCTEAAREFTGTLNWDEIAERWMDLFLAQLVAA